MGIMDKYVKEDDEWQKVEFEKTMNSLKPTFERNGWYAPRDFREVREWHYYEIKKNPPEREDLPERAMIQDREIYIQWAKANQKEEETAQTKKKETAPPERGETNAVKYKLLDHFFKGNPEFDKLLIKDQEHLLGFILGCRADTAKSIKNQSKPDGKHITEIAMDRFTELLDKIKKGELT
jgi:hypothetical protein